MEEIKTNAPAPVEVVDVQFRSGQKIYYFDPAGKTYQTGDHVIMDTARGPEYGICVGGNQWVHPAEVVAPLRRILRVATEQDEKCVLENQEKENRAYKLCTQMAREQNLDMQLVGVECAFDGSKMLFFFTADERVDFRELVKNLAGQLHTRIELRQIGVRDKARMVGGLGICGRPFCCASFLDDFQPVSIKMAKTQNLSLNPVKISGTCGRLMCCLKYEQDAYEDLIRTSPKAESLVDTPAGRGTVAEIDLLRQRVKVRMEDQPENLTWYSNAEVAVLRSGKGKKNDPPIPADYAPISGIKKREETEEPRVLEAIKLRHSEETVAEERPIQEEAAESENAQRHTRRRNRKNKRQNGAQKETVSAEQAPEQAEKKPAGRRNHFHRRHRNKPTKE